MWMALVMCVTTTVMVTAWITIPITAHWRPMRTRQTATVMASVTFVMAVAVIPLAPGLIITDLATGALFLNAALAYVLVALIALQLLLERAGLVPPPPGSPLLQTLLWVNLAGVAQRFAVRFCCTAREFGWRQGLLAIPRTFVSNIIAIMAGRRALLAYIGTLRGAPVVWDKTEHRDHPALVLPGRGTA